jgi:hypothetical protein
LYYKSYLQNTLLNTISAIDLAVGRYPSAKGGKWSFLGGKNGSDYVPAKDRGSSGQYLRQNLWVQKKDGFDKKLTLYDPL